jgi:hypothetical protein
MIVSQARILSSQANGRLSKGPVTPEGKQVSRSNSLKHGLTGEGIVLPDEDVEEVSRRFVELRAQFNPATPMGKILVNRVAFLSVRLERSAEQEAAYLGEKIRHARDDHDHQRQIEIEGLLGGIANQPSMAVRKLLRTPEGIDALIRDWSGLREDLARPDLKSWTATHNERAHHLSGRRVEEIPISRIDELSHAIWGDFRLLSDHEGAGLDVEGRREWARGRLLEFIDEELAALRDCREGLDLEAFAQDREESPRRALFDASKPAVLARRYEAANERGLFRALKELQKVEKEAASSPQPSPAYPIRPLGSFLPASEATPEPSDEPEADADKLPTEGLPTASPSFSRSPQVGFAEETGVPGGIPRLPSVN